MDETRPRFNVPEPEKPRDMDAIKGDIEALSRELSERMDRRRKQIVEANRVNREPNIDELNQGIYSLRDSLRGFVEEAKKHPSLRGDDQRLLRTIEAAELIIRNANGRKHT